MFGATALFFCGISLSAQAGITFIPKTLNIKATQGNIITRTLTLQSDSPIQKIEVIKLDLTRGDGAIVLPSEVISSKILPLPEPTPGNLQQVLITIDLTKINQSGEFNGNLLIRSTDGNSEIPLVLEIKDGLFLPLIILVLGVLLGVGLSVYRAEGKDRDQLVVQIGRLRTRMRADAELTNSFKIKMEGNLAIADTQLDDKRWTEANIVIGNAQLLWQKWLQYRQDWLAQATYLDTLKTSSKQQGLPETIPYGQAVFAAIADLENQAADFKTPQRLHDELVKLREQVEQYQQGRAFLTQIVDLLQQLPDTEKELWKKKNAQLDQQLDGLNPSNVDAFKQWKQDIATARNELVDGIEKKTGNEVVAESLSLRSRDLKVTSLQQPGLVPTVSQSPSSEANIVRAQWRIIAVNWLGRIIAIVTLSWMGLNQLYAGKPTFGSEPFTDYFPLMVWGLGAETTRSSVVKVIQDLGVPLSKQNLSKTDDT